jgi:hypothetical protein
MLYYNGGWSTYMDLYTLISVPIMIKTNLFWTYGTWL